VRLTRAGLGHLWRHPWQTWLSVLGIALGVAVVVAVDIANQSARRAFILSMETLTGRATHRVVGGPAGFDETLYRRLRVDKGLRPSAPVVEGRVGIGGETFRLLGVDPLADAPFRHGLSTFSGGDLSRLLTEPNSLLMAGVSAQRLGVTLGDRVSVSTDGQVRRARILGLIEGPQQTALDGLLVADIATAQALLDRVGVLDRIDLILGPDQTAEVEQLLPQGLRLESARARTHALAQMSDAFQTNLAAMGLLALLVGAFLIYNTMTFSVLQRRELLGTLRTLGVGRSQVFAQVLLEALALGLIGTAVGLLLGLAVGQGLLRLVTRTINDLYFALTVSRVTPDPWVLAKGVAIGVGASLLAAIGPAWEAARSEPRSVLRRSQIEARAHHIVPWLTLAGAATAVLGGGLLWAPGRGLGVAFTALFLVILGFALVVPALTLIIARAAAPALGRVAGSLGRMAAIGLAFGLSRAGLAVAALTVAVAASVGVANMIHSFRSAVEDWLAQTLRSDIYVSGPETPADSAAGALDPSVADRIARVEGVRELSRGRSLRVDGPRGPVQLLAIRTASESHRGFELIGSPAPGLWRSFAAGESLLISEPYAWHHQVRVGDTIALFTKEGSRDFRVGGIFRDYGSDGGMLVINGDTYARLWADPAVSTVGVFLEEDADLPKALGAIRAALSDLGGGYRIRSNRAIREESLAIFDRTFTITRVLRLLAVGVAFIGILSALMTLQLEKAREHALLRAMGVTRRQVLALIGLQTGLVGLIAGLLALPLGWVLSEILIHVVNRRSFGWSMPSVLPVDALWEGLLLALGAALLAGLYPAWRVSRIEPALALRDE
jgi:putative ABC transport system permease protein